MVMNKDTFEIVLSTLKLSGYPVQVPEQALRTAIIDKCNTTDRSVVSRIIGSMQDAGMIKSIGFKMWEICHPAD